MANKDGRRAWCVALACCTLNFVIAGLGRISGILYVAFIEMYAVNRQEATIPFSVRSSMRNLMGPIAGILGQQYGAESMIMIGCLVCVITTTACYFAASMLWITVLFGVLGGIGTAMAITLAQVIINKHFEKYYATASGLAFSGGCVASFVFPTLIEFLLDNYSLSGTFLLIAGMFLHTLPAAMILREQPSKRKKEGKQLRTNIFEKTLNTSELVQKYKTEQSNGESTINIEDSQTKQSNGVTLTRNCVSRRFLLFEKSPLESATILLEALKWHRSKNLSSCYNLSSGSSDINLEDIKCILNATYLNVNNQAISPTEELCSENKQSEKSEDIIDQISIDTKRDCVYSVLRSLKDKSYFDSITCGIQEENPILNLISVRVILSELVEMYEAYEDTIRTNEYQLPPNTEPPKVKSFYKEFTQHCITALYLNKNPMFHLICVCRAIHFFVMVPLTTVIVDFAMDKGISRTEGTYVISAFAGGDLLGRLGLGWVTDRNYITVPRYMLLAMTIQGICVSALAFIHRGWLIFAVSAIVGMLQGSVFIRQPVSLTYYITESEKSIAMGSVNFCAGLMGLTLPAFIGYFRDTLGSYDHMFLISGAMCAGVGLLWIFEPKLAKYTPQRRLQERSDIAGTKL